MVRDEEALTAGGLGLELGVLPEERADGRERTGAPMAEGGQGINHPVLKSGAVMPDVMPAGDQWLANSAPRQTTRGEKVSAMLLP